MKTQNQPSAPAEMMPTAQNHFGEVIAVFPTRHQTYLRIIGTALGWSILIAALGFFALRLSAMITAIQFHGRAILLQYATSLLLLLACLPLGFMILVVTVIHWNNHLTLYQHGLIKRQGLRKKTWIWRATTRLDTRITHVKFGGNIVHIRTKLIIGSPQATLVVRNRYRDMPDLVQKIRAILIPILWDWAQQQFAHNRPIEFHPELTATRQGLKIHEDQHPWPGIGAAKIKHQKLVLEGTQDHQTLLQVSLNKVINLDLLLFLINHPPVKPH
jgi:hypothetical protein